MNLQSNLLIIIFLFANVLSDFPSVPTIKGQCPNVRTSLLSVRKRRHLAFPPGSAVTLVTSVVKTFMTHVPSGWYLVVEGEVVYKLPDAEFISAHLRRKLHHRQKKEVWETLQRVLEQRNMNGRACIIRSICEAQRHLAPKGRSLVHDILRAMFTSPLQDQEFVQEMGLTYSELLEPDFCDKPNDCPFSILGFILELNKQR